MSRQDGPQKKVEYRGDTPPNQMASLWSLGGASNEPLSLEQQLAEARFLAAFCHAVYAERDPKNVCATAAQCLYEYFRYQLAQFSFVDAELESLSFMPGGKGGERRVPTHVTPVPPPILRKRRFSLTENGGFDITVRFPTGLGQLRILEAEQGNQVASADFLQGIADCLAAALDIAIEHSRLQELSLRDALTGLLNRRAFEELLSIEEGRRQGPSLSLVMIDIDDFKSINDRFGHPAGDQVIAAIGKAITEALRGADLAARYGGEEFAVLLPNTTVKDAYSVAERLRCHIAELAFEFGGHPLQVTASLGVANRCRKEDCTVHDLLKVADEALYQAKHSGKNRTLIHDLTPLLRKNARRRLPKTRLAPLSLTE